jgi:(4S)-4-hydroxy-5-phosphonooxypentane-2,3-dione isomerase
MVTRIVKMTFRNESCEEFMAIFHKYKEQIRHTPGCLSLTLLREKANSPVFFTYSYWEDEGKLDAYRYSDTFAEVWPQTKALFSAPAEAWTTDTLVYLP